MEIQSTEITSKSIKLSIEDAGNELARVYLYLVNNDLHGRPLGYIEDLFVLEKYRNQGYGKRLMEKVIEEAKKQNCYKIFLTSRHGRDQLHEWYKNLGFSNHGKCFRLNLP